MFFRERCSLCGGKLDSNNICTECGLDNNKSEKHYHVNQSSCDGQPLTHVHTKSEYYSGSADRDTRRKSGAGAGGAGRAASEAERTQSGTGRSQAGRTQSRGGAQRTWGTRGRSGYYNTYTAQEGRARRVRGKKIAIVIIILVVLIAVVPPLLGEYISQKEYESNSYSSYDYSYSDDYEYDPYAYVTREIPAEVESYSQQFSQGDYVVGVHIPEGTYVADSSGEDYISLSVDDSENGIYLYESLDADTTQVDDIRLYTGAVVTVSGDGYLTLSADNAQTGQMGGQANPLTESVSIRGGQTVTAGDDFPAGVYDIRAAYGYGSPEITVYDEDGNELQTLYIWISDSSVTESSYLNAVLPEGTVIVNADEDLDLELTPSQTIGSEDYMSYYQYD